VIRWIVRGNGNMANKSVWVLLTLLTLNLGCSGSGDSNRPKMYPVSGTVKFNGTAVEGATVTFQLTEGKGRRMRLARPTKAANIVSRCLVPTMGQSLDSTKSLYPSLKRQSHPKLPQRLGKSPAANLLRITLLLRVPERHPAV